MLSQGLPNTPMAGGFLRVTGGNFITARPVGVVDGVDFQYTGAVRKVIAEEIQADLAQENVVLITPIGASPTGEIFNLAWEEVAEAVATAIEADKLIYLCDARRPGRQEGATDRRADRGRGGDPAGQERSSRRPKSPASCPAPCAPAAPASAACISSTAQRRRDADGVLHPRRRRHGADQRAAGPAARGDASTTSAPSWPDRSRWKPTARWSSAAASGWKWRSRASRCSNTMA